MLILGIEPTTNTHHQYIIQVVYLMQKSLRNSLLFQHLMNQSEIVWFILNEMQNVFQVFRKNHISGIAYSKLLHLLPEFIRHPCKLGLSSLPLFLIPMKS